MIWFCDADVAEAVDAVLFVGSATWPTYLRLRCLRLRVLRRVPRRRQAAPGRLRDLGFVGPICNLRDVDWGTSPSARRPRPRPSTPSTVAARLRHPLRVRLVRRRSWSATHGTRSSSRPRQTHALSV